jgi:hypothetical protein
VTSWGAGTGRLQGEVQSPFGGNRRIRTLGSSANMLAHLGDLELPVLVRIAMQGHLRGFRLPSQVSVWVSGVLGIVGVLGLLREKIGTPDG